MSTTWSDYETTWPLPTWSRENQYYIIHITGQF